MKYIDIIIIGFCLASDAFAVSLCKGFSFRRISIMKAILIASYFGLFQGLMTYIGFILGNKFNSLFIIFEKLIAFILLFIIGLDMIHEGIKSEEVIDDRYDFKSMVVLSIATSIDAFVSGVTFSLFNINIIYSSFIIMLITFILCFFGVIIGSKFYNYFGNKSKILGGIILIILAIKMLIEQLL
jgi:putative Mn2+ efflux pump MntP